MITMNKDDFGMKYLTEIESYLSLVHDTLSKINRSEISELMQVLEDAYLKERSIFVLGNGGSAATASHFCNDFNKGISYGRTTKFKVQCLNDNVATLLALANDVGYNQVFIEQLKNFVKREDIVIGISGSGNSENVIKAIEYANSRGATTVGLLGFNGGKLKSIVKHSLLVPINNMQVVEDVHLVINHLLMYIFDSFLPKSNITA